MQWKIVAVPTLILGSTVGLTAGSTAVVDAPTTVTIKAEQTDLSGTVSSSRPARCANNRKVIVIKQRGTRGGGDDQVFASDTAGRSGGIYTWSTGTTGTEGRFYARVKPKLGCKGDTSPTIIARRDN